MVTNGKPMRRSSSAESWEESARLLKILSHPVRLLILAALAEKSFCVKDLNALVPIPQPHLSQHMAALRKAGLVASHKDGPLRCYYVLRPSFVGEIIPLLRRQHPVKERDREAVQREARRDSEA